MAHYELGLKLQRDSPYDELSRKYPSMTMAIWCNYEKDVVEITYEDLDIYDVLQEDLKKLTRTIGARQIHKSFTKSNVQLVTQHCGCLNIKHLVVPVIESHNCLEIPPAIYREGWEWRKIIAFSERDIRSLFRDLEKYCTIEITSRRRVEERTVRDTFLLSPANLFGDLTERQTQALLLAVESGYYSVPRGATTGEIAKRLGLPRTSFGEHLRKAENKVLRAVAPYAQFYKGGRKKGRPAIAQRPLQQIQARR